MVGHHQMIHSYYNYEIINTHILYVEPRIKDGTIQKKTVVEEIIQMFEALYVTHVDLVLLAFSHYVDPSGRLKRYRL